MPRGVEMTKSISERVRVPMYSRILTIFFSMVLLLVPSTFASAQQQSESIQGYWKQKGESFYIKIDNADGEMSAEVIRNDWAPGLVGTTFFSNILPVQGRKGRWAGEAPNPNSSRAGKATIRMTRDGEMSVRLRPGGRSVWRRTDAVEKRY